MNNRADGVREAHPLFQAEGGGSLPTSALCLRFSPCDESLAIRLNQEWHSRLPKVLLSNIVRVTLRACYIAEANGLYYASAIWTSPTTSQLPQDRWLELRRLAIAPDAPRFTASRMLGWMVRDIRKRFPQVVRLISYQDCEVHTGTIYRAAGWLATVKNYDHRDRGKRTHRKRSPSQTMATKQRWEKVLREPPPAPAPLAPKPDEPTLFDDEKTR